LLRVMQIFSVMPPVSPVISRSLSKSHKSRMMFIMVVKLLLSNAPRTRSVTRCGFPLLAASHY
jgi:hypothetical protein